MASDPAALVKVLTDLAKGVSPQTTSSSSTTSINSSTQAALLQQILQSSGGLAAVAGGQRTAGLYNSTVNQQMINDLLARASGEVASKSSTTTQKQTTSPSVNVGAVGKTAALLQAAGTLQKVGKPVAEYAGKKLGINSPEELGNKLMSALGFGEPDISYTSADLPQLGGFTNPVNTSLIPSAGVGDVFAGSSDLADLSSYFGGTPVDVGSLAAPDTVNLASTDVGSTSSGTSSSFSVGSTDAASASQTNSAAGGGDINWLKAAQYANNPKQRGDILDFSDGDWKDDISDITDAASIVVPEAALVRPTLNTTDAMNRSAASFTGNPGEWWHNFMAGDDPWIQAQNEQVDSIGRSIVQTGNDIGAAANTVGGAVEDVFSGIGKAFGF